MAIRRAQLEKCQLCRVQGIWPPNGTEECELCGGTGYVIMPKDDDD